LQLAEGGEIWNTYLSATTKPERRYKLSNLLVTPACCKVLLCPVLFCRLCLLSLNEEVIVCRFIFLSFVFVERSGIFENFLLGFVGRQALLDLPFPLKK